MKKNKEYSFRLEDVFFPLIFSHYNKNQKTKKLPTFSVLYKIQAHIISPDSIEVLFGTQTFPKVSKQKEFPLKITVETLGSFKFTEKVFNKNSKTLESIKPLPNMLAILFPFIREKVNSLIFNNKGVFYLPPVNTFNLVESMKDKIIILNSISKK